MSAVIHRIDHPAMLMRIINHTRKGCIFKTEAHTRWINMRSNPNDRMHQLIQKSTMRDDQIFSRRLAQELLQSLPGAQEQGPIALPFPADGVIGCDIGRLG